MIDVNEAIISYFASDPTIQQQVDDRVSVRQQFGKSMSWGEPPAKALTVRIDGGTPDIYIQNQDLRLEIRCYGASYIECGEVWRVFADLVRNTERKTVTLEDSTVALIHFMIALTGPVQLYDTDLESPFILTFVRAFVDERVVP